MKGVVTVMAIENGYLVAPVVPDLKPGQSIPTHFAPTAEAVAEEVLRLTREFERREHRRLKVVPDNADA